MRIEKIYFEQLFPTGNFSNQRLGMEITIEDRDMFIGSPSQSVQNAYELAKNLVNEAFKKLNPDPSPPTQTDYHSGPTPEIQVEKIEIGDLPTQIQSCKELKVLESYKLMVKGKTDLEKLYLDKLEELQSLQNK